MPFNTPIVLIIFNRPELTAYVLNKIREIKPSFLHVIADGARNENEVSIVQKTRDVLDQSVDWECQITKDYSDVNLGCRKRIVSGLNHAFDLFEEAIILEDDIIPTKAFFVLLKML